MARQQTEIIYRRNAVLETLRANNRKINKLWFQDNLPKNEIQPFIKLAKNAQIPLGPTDKQRLGHLAKDKGHQGVVLEVGSYKYADVDDMLALAKERDEPPFILVMDLVQGPQNIGMLVRTAEACGVHGIIMQDKRAPEITPAMVIASQGATEHLHITKVTNLNQTLRYLKKKDVWVVGTAMDESAQPLGKLDLNMPIALVIGHEGSGVRKQVQETCDFLVTLPMRGKVESLNAAVSGSVLLYFAWQARGFPS